jgi:hypothetical protein
MTSALQGNDDGCCHGNKHHVDYVYVAASEKFENEFATSKFYFGVPAMPFSVHSCFHRAP